MTLRQQARLSGVPAFSILDLMTELTRQGTPLSSHSVLRRLASQYVVDLPLGADDLVEIAAADGWRPGPAHTALARPAWWQAQDADWPGTWLPVAAEARKRSAVAFLDITKAALTGAPEFRHQRLPNHAVPAASRYRPHRLPRDRHHRPPGPARSPRGLRPRGLPRPRGGTAPQFVLGALERELTRRSVAHPGERAREILPGTDSTFT